MSLAEGLGISLFVYWAAADAGGSVAAAATCGNLVCEAGPGGETPETCPGDCSIDPDGDGLTNFEEFFLGSDPANPDATADYDGDGFSNIAEKSDPMKTDPADPSSFPGDGNLVINPGVLWHEAPPKQYLPAGWAEKNECLEGASGCTGLRSASWVADPADPTHNVVLQTEVTEFGGQNPDGTLIVGSVKWKQSLVLEPDTWYEFSASYATDQIEPIIDPTTSEIDRRTVAIGPRLGFASESGHGISGVDVGFSPRGPQLTDWDSAVKAYRTYTVKGFEDWRSPVSYFKTPGNLLTQIDPPGPPKKGNTDLSTLHSPRGFGYYDRFKVKKVAGNYDPGIPPLVRAGTLNFMQYQGGDFFPIGMNQLPLQRNLDYNPLDPDSDEFWHVDLDWYRQNGFNTVPGGEYRGRSNPSYLKPLWEAADLAVTIKVPSPLAGPDNPNEEWIYDDPNDGVAVNYTGFAEMKQVVGKWIDLNNDTPYSNLLMFRGGQGELQNHPAEFGAFIPQFKTLEAFGKYISRHNGRLHINHGFGMAPYTGVLSDWGYYYPLGDSFSHTGNLPESYSTDTEANTHAPEMLEVGKHIRRAVLDIQSRGLDIPVITYGLGTHTWAKWDGLSCPEDGSPCVRYVPFNLQRFQVFDQIINGSVGVIFTGNEARGEMNLEDPVFGYFAEQVTQITRELASLYDVLIEPEFYDEWTVSDPRVEIMLKKHAGRLYLFAASVHTEDLTNVAITLSSNHKIFSVTALNDVINGNVRVPIDRVIVPATTRKFKDNFIGEHLSVPQELIDLGVSPNLHAPGYAVHVYEVRLDDNGDGLPDDL